MRPSPPSRLSSASCSRSHNPAAVHSEKRRCAVARVTPKEASGSFHHEQPAWVTYTIAASIARSSVLRRPPPCLRRGAGGINGSAIAHSAPDAHRWIVASSTKRHHAAGRDRPI